MCFRKICTEIKGICLYEEIIGISSNYQHTFFLSAALTGVCDILTNNEDSEPANSIVVVSIKGYICHMVFSKCK